MYTFNLSAARHIGYIFATARSKMTWPSLETPFSQSTISLQDPVTDGAALVLYFCLYKAKQEQSGNSSGF